MPPLINLLKETFEEYDNDNVPRLGAALAYYSIFSLGPLLLIAISIAGTVFGEEAVSGELFGQIRGLVGDQGAEAIAELVKHSGTEDGSLWASVVGIVTLLFGATGVIVQLKDALNVVWEVKPAPGKGLRLFLKKYILSLGAIMGFGFLLMISLTASALIAGFGKYLNQWLPAPEAVLLGINVVVTLGVFTGMIGCLFKFLPDVDLRWRDVWPGAVFTAVLFVIGKFLIGLYLGKQSIGSTYGAAGSFVVILIWIYYSSQIIFLGAEFTEVYARRFGAGATPSRDAVSLTSQDRVRSGVASSP